MAGGADERTTSGARVAATSLSSRVSDTVSQQVIAQNAHRTPVARNSTLRAPDSTRAAASMVSTPPRAGSPRHATMRAAHASSPHAADHESRGRAAATVKPSPASTVPLSGSVNTSSNNGPSSHRSSAGAAAVAATADGPSAAIARSNGMVATQASVSHHACGMTPAPARLWSCPASVHGPHIPVSLSLPCDQICIARCRMGAVPHYNQDWQASSPTIAPCHPCPRTKARLPLGHLFAAHAAVLPGWGGATFAAQCCQHSTAQQQSPR